MAKFKVEERQLKGFAHKIADDVTVLFGKKIATLTKGTVLAMNGATGVWSKYVKGDTDFGKIGAVYSGEEIKITAAADVEVQVLSIAIVRKDMIVGILEADLKLKVLEFRQIGIYLVEGIGTTEVAY